jgi:hypothetical protein
MRRLAPTLLVLAVASPLSAQGAPCFRGARSDRCNDFLITEFALGPGTTTSSRRPPFIGEWEIGGMHNLGLRSALGSTLFALYDESDRAYVGIRPRYRRWLGSAGAVDLSAGLFIADLNDRARFSRLPALTVRTTLMWKDLIGITAGMDALRPGLGPSARTETAFLIGLRLGSYPGVAAWPLGVAFAYLSNRNSN